MASEVTELVSRPIRTGRYHPAAAVWVPLALAACAALAIRIIKAAGSGLWRDEGLFLFVADCPTIGDVIDFLRFHESHPPLFYLLMRLWRAVFGPSLAAAEALPVVLGVAQVPVAYMVGARMFSRRAGVIAAVLVAVCPSLIYYSTLVRPYSLLPLLGLASTYYLWSGLRGGGWLAWLGYVLTMLAMLYTHNWCWVFLAAHWAVAVVWLAWFRGPWGAVRGWVLAQVGVAVGYAPWLPVLLHQVRHAGHSLDAVDWRSAMSVQLYLMKAATLLNAALSPFGKLWLSALLTTCLVVVAADLYRRRDRRPDLPPGWWAGTLLMAAVPFLALAIVLVLSAKTKLLIARCLVITAPCFLIAVAQVLAALSPPGRLALPAALTLMLVLADARAVAVKATGVRSNAREMAAALAAQVRPADIVVIAPDYLASSFNLYFRSDNQQIVYPHEGRLERIVADEEHTKRRADPRELERVKALLAQAFREGRRVWLVTDWQSTFVDDVPVTDSLRAHMAGNELMLGAWLRTIQVRKYLVGLYGPPNLEAAPVDRRLYGDLPPGFEYECLSVLLFAPPEP
jgi:mannosyltransferase